MDRPSRLHVLLWAGVLLGLVAGVVGVVLVLNAYVPPADILSSDGRPIPFFQTIKPVPFGIGIAGLLMAIASVTGLFRGRALRHW